MPVFQTAYSDITVTEGGRSVHVPLSSTHGGYEVLSTLRLTSGKYTWSMQVAENSVYVGVASAPAAGAEAAPTGFRGEGDLSVFRNDPFSAANGVVDFTMELDSKTLRWCTRPGAEDPSSSSLSFSSLSGPVTPSITLTHGATAKCVGAGSTVPCVHSFVRDDCMICKSCHSCTGYGAACCHHHKEGRRMRAGQVHHQPPSCDPQAHRDLAVATMPLTRLPVVFTPQACCLFLISPRSYYFILFRPRYRRVAAVVGNPDARNVGSARRVPRSSRDAARLLRGGGALSSNASSCNLPSDGDFRPARESTLCRLYPRSTPGGVRQWGSSLPHCSNSHVGTSSPIKIFNVLHPIVQRRGYNSRRQPAWWQLPRLPRSLGNRREQNAFTKRGDNGP